MGLVAPTSLESISLIRAMDRQQEIRQRKALLEKRAKDIKALLEEGRCPQCHLRCVHHFEGGSEGRVYFKCDNPYCRWEACAFPADLEAGNYIDLL